MFVSGEMLIFSGVLTSHGNSLLHQGNYGGGGAGGSVWVQGDSVDLSKASAVGGSQCPAGGYGRITVYYQTSVSVHGSPNAYIYSMEAGTPAATPTGTPIIPTSQPPVSG